jgi:hypothetical protein
MVFDSNQRANTEAMMILQFTVRLLLMEVKMSLFNFIKNLFISNLLILTCASILNLHGMAGEARHVVTCVAKQCFRASERSVQSHEAVKCTRDFAVGVFDPINGKLGDAQITVQTLYRYFTSIYYSKKTYAHELIPKDLVPISKVSEAELEVVHPTRIKRSMVIGGAKIKVTIHGLDLAKIQAAQENAIAEEQHKLAAENKKAEALAKARLLSAKSAVDYFGDLKDLATLAHSRHWKLNLVDTQLVLRANVCCASYYYQRFGMLYGIGLTEMPVTSVMQFTFKLDSSEIDFDGLGFTAIQKLDLLNALIKYSLIESHEAIIDINWLTSCDINSALKATIVSAVVKQIEQHAAKRYVTKIKLYLPAACHAELKLLHALGYQLIDSIVNAKADCAVVGYIVQKML